VGLAKRLAKIPPVLFLEASLVDSDLETGGGEVGTLMVLVRLIVGLAAKCVLVGSRADILLDFVSICKLST
jgi:hypothetical protein